MGWTKPSSEEIKMDAEIGSYQADERENNPVLVLNPSNQDDEHGSNPLLSAA